MKNIIIIVIAAFVITDKTTEGYYNVTSLYRPVQRKVKPPCKVPPPTKQVVPSGNKTIIKSVKQKSVPRRHSPVLKTDPVVVKKKFRCLCNLAVCVCKQYENPEIWYVKTFLRGDTKVKPALYTLKPYNSTVRPKKKPKRFFKKNTHTHKKSFPLLCPRKKELKGVNKWLFGCPPLLNLKKTENKEILSQYYSVQCDCLNCKLHPFADKSGVILKCIKGGPIYTNETNEKINFSKLVDKRKNQLIIQAKFVQIKYN